MDDIRTQVINKFNTLKPRNCEICKCIYNDLDDVDCMECFICEKRICPSCLPLEAPRFGLLPVCDECEIKYKSKNKPTINSIRSNNTNILNDLTKDTILNSTMINMNEVADKERDKNETPKDPKKDDNTKVCSFYLNKKCRYGRAGKECKYLHPKLCYSYLNKGSEGCNKDDCQYYHPKICKFLELS